MSTRNLNWYALNGTRRWPVDDAATGEADDGASLKNDVIVDAAVRVPADLCSLVAVSSVTVTKTLVTVTLVGVAAHPTPPAGASVGAQAFVPLGVVSVRKPAAAGRPYPIRPLADGVGGWLVFGAGLEKSVRHRFSTPAQAVLAPRACRFYRRPPVTSIGKQFNALALTGVVLVRGGTDVEVVAAERELDGRERDVIVVRLRSNTPRNLFDLYRGPCGGRPESRTCNRDGVEYINTVGPDCDGDVRIEFPSPLRASYYPGGVALDYPYGLIDACTRDDRLPDANGKLPNQYPDECAVSSVGDPDANAGRLPPVGAGGGDGLPAGVSSEAVEPARLPVMLHFDADWNAVYPEAGGWALAPVESPFEPPYQVVTIVPYTAYDEVRWAVSESSGSSASSSSMVPREATSSEVTETTGADQSAATTDLATRNVALWAGSVGTGSAGVRLTTDVKIGDGAGTAGVLFNYRAGGGGAFQYWAVELSRASSRLQIRHWNGLAWVNLVSAGPLVVAADRWYTVEGAVQDLGGGVYRLTARAWDAGTLLASITTDVNDYAPADGYLGLVADRTLAAYSYLRVEAHP